MNSIQTDFCKRSKEEPDDQGGLTQPPEPPSALKSFLSQRGIAAVRRILLLHKIEMQDANFINLPPDELRLYFTLTARAETPQTIPSAEAMLFEPQMVRVPEGKFLMGTTKEQAQVVLEQKPNDKNLQKWIEWEQPQHTVELSEYSIGKYPITNREYQAFVRDEKYKSPLGWDGDQFPKDQGGYPVVNVTWEDAIAYCKWLGKTTKKPYRLPTEAEWEKAARGEDGRIYPWGNEFDPQKAKTRETSIRSATPVGQFSPQGDSPFGCSDMVGNVWEWCSDCFSETEYLNRQGEIKKDPKGPLEGDRRVIRGGSFNRYKNITRCTTRTANHPYEPGDAKGFRVALSYSILSLREEEVLLLIKEGLSNKQIANNLNLSQQTVKNHVTAILRKLKVTNRKDAIKVALRENVIYSKDD